MSELLLNQNITEDKTVRAKEALEEAREAHERYLIKQQNNDLEIAIENYIDAVKLDPSLAESYYRLASLMWDKGQITLNSAIEQCKTATTLAPKNVNAHIYTGYFMRLAQEFPEATAEFKTAIKLSRLSSGRPRLMLAQNILQEMNVERSAKRNFAKFLYYFLTGSLMIMWDKPSLNMLYKNMEDDFAVFSYKSIGGFLEKFKMAPLTFKIYQKAIDKTCHSSMFYNKMGDLCIKCGDYDTGCDCYRNALTANPDSRETLVKLATVNQTYFPDNIDETIDCYSKLLEVDDDRAKIYYELGHAYLAKEDKLHSVSAFKLALELEPDNAFYNNSLAFALVKAELYDDAIEYYQKAIKLNPDKEWTSIICQALGAIYSEIKGNFEAAIATFQAGIVLDSNNYDLYISLGDVYMAQNDIDTAIRTYCDAITLNPQDYRGYSKAGLALWEKDYIEEAIISYHKAIDLNPEFDIAQNNLGVIYLDDIGTADEALKYFLKAIDINPNYTLAYFNAGRSYEQLGENKNAADYYQMSLDLNKLTEDLEEQDILDRIYGLFDL